MESLFGSELAGMPAMHTMVILIGAGGFAREVLDITAAFDPRELPYDVQGYVVDPQYGTPGTMINDKPILGDMDWLAKHADDYSVICCIGAPQNRRKLVIRAKKFGCKFCSIIHPSALLTRWVSIGEGVVITAGCIVTNQIRIGNHVHLNLDCTIGHDSVLEDFVTLAPGVHVSGHVTLREGCYIGTGANIIENITVGAWSIIGAGSTIVDNVPPNTTVVGVPGRVIKTRKVGWHSDE